MKAFALRREPPPPQIFTLVRASASPYEVDKTIQHSGSFGDAVVRCTNRRRGVALLTSRDEHVTSSFIVTPGQSIDSTVVKGGGSTACRNRIGIEIALQGFKQCRHLGYRPARSRHLRLARTNPLAKRP